MGHQNHCLKRFHNRTSSVSIMAIIPGVMATMFRIVAISGC